MATRVGDSLGFHGYTNTRPRLHMFEGVYAGALQYLWAYHSGSHVTRHMSYALQPESCSPWPRPQCHTCCCTSVPYCRRTAVRDVWVSSAPSRYCVPCGRYWRAACHAALVVCSVGCSLLRQLLPLVGVVAQHTCRGGLFSANSQTVGANQLHGHGLSSCLSYRTECPKSSGHLPQRPRPEIHLPGLPGSCSYTNE